MSMSHVPHMNESCPTYTCVLHAPHNQHTHIPLHAPTVVSAYRACVCVWTCACVCVYVCVFLSISLSLLLNTFEIPLQPPTGVSARAQVCVCRHWRSERRPCQGWCQEVYHEARVHTQHPTYQLFFLNVLFTLPRTQKRSLARGWAIDNTKHT